MRPSHRAPFKPPRMLAAGDAPAPVPRPMAKRQPLPQAAPAKKPRPDPSSDRTVYNVQWRKFSNKKNKTWDGDGTLVVSGPSMFLKDDKKTIAKSALKPLEGVVRMGGYELEIDTVDDAVLSPVVTQQFKAVAPGAKTKPGPRKPLYPADTPDALVMKRPPDQENPVVDVVVDPSLVKSLRPHQVEAVRFMYNAVMGFEFQGNGVLLADEMGLGKTLTTITLMWTLLKQSPYLSERSVAHKVLIVCPVTLISNWRKEIKKWLNVNSIGVLVVDNNSSNYKDDVKNFGKTRTYQVLIISYERLVNCEEEIVQNKFDLLVCDEGHKLKSATNKSMKVLNALDIEKKVLLTGTPVQNNLNEFYNLVNFINPNILGKFTEFQKTYVRPIEQSKESNCYNKEVGENGKFAAAQLNAIIKQFILRRTSEILFNYLSEKTDVLMFVKPTKPQLRLFDFLSSNFSLSSIESSNSLALINLYKKICNSPSLLASDSMFQSLGYQGELPLASGKINLLVVLLMEIINKKKEKVVLISNYTKTLDIIQSVLLKLNLSFLRLDGSTASSARTQLINQFNQTKFPNFPIFLLSSKSGGMGINLIGASRLILFDNDWNPAHDLQSMSRIYRDGQKKPVFVYRLFTTGCIDEKIFQRQLMKNNLSDQLMVLDNLDAGSDTFDVNELRDLFTVHANTSSNTHEIICNCEGKGEQMEPPEPEAPDLSSSQSTAWTTALNLSQLKDQDEAKKTTIKRALSDYKHYDPKDDINCEDTVVNEVLKASRANEDLSVSYVFTKVSNPAL